MLQFPVPPETEADNSTVPPKHTSTSSASIEISGSDTTCIVTVSTSSHPLESVIVTVKFLLPVAILLAVIVLLVAPVLQLYV